MKSAIKKIFAFLLSVVMVLAMSVTVFAAEPKTEANLKINNKANATYTAYKIMDAQVSGTDSTGKPVYTYTVTADFAGFFGNAEYGNYKLGNNKEIYKSDGTTLVASDGTTANVNNTDAAALASQLEKYAQAKGLTGTTVPDTGLKTDIGYYLVSETATTSNEVYASKPILVDLRDDVNINPKNDKIELEKKIVEGDKKADSNTANIGDVVNYEVTSSIPVYKANVDSTKLSYELTDTFTNLKYNNDAEITLGTAKLVKDTDYIETPADGSFKIELKPATIFAHQGETLTLKYSATLQDTAVVDSPDGNPNKIVLKYSNNPNNANSKGELSDEVKTYTFGLKIHKVDKNDNNKDMAGAKFEVYDKTGAKIGSFEYGANGEITNTKGKITVEGNYATIKGLDEGEYSFKEVVAPKDYSLLANPVKVKIEDTGKLAGGEANGVAKVTIVSGEGTIEGTTEVSKVENNNGVIDIVVKIENVKGISLPQTGAKTAMYCLLGGAVMIVLGGLYFGISKFSKNKKH